MTYSIIYATDLCAGTINLQSQLSVTTKSKTMDVSLELSNKGQTPSYDIIARITFFGKTKESKTISCLNPDATEKMLMIFDLQKNMKGDYPLIVEIQFHDINLYPFYSMRCTPIHIQSQTLDKRLTVQVPNIELSEQNKIDVHILNQNNLKKYVTVLMIVPGAFVCENNTHYKLLPKGQSVDIEYFLLKKDALPGSKHQGYVVITYIENAVNYAQITPFQISVKPVAQIWLFKKKNIAHIWFGVFLIWVLCMTYVMIIFKEFPKKNRRTIMNHSNTKKILIVDDVSLNIRIVKDILTENGYNLDSATSGRKALEKTESENYDLILLDVRMPGMNGFEVCAKLRNHPKTKDVPIIFLTGEDEASSITKGFEAGAMDYVTKPFYDTELLARVRTHLELSHSKKALKDMNDRLMHEIEERKKIENELRSSKEEYQYLAEHDNLTGLFNTRYLYQRLNQMIIDNRADEIPFSLIFMDIDNFKHVVDAYGHLNGSQVIQEVAQTIQSTLTLPAFAVAYAGDEFIIVLPGYERNETKEKAESIRQHMRMTTYLSQKNFAIRLSASFGISTYPNDTTDLTRLLSLADQAMFDVKAHGKDAVL